MKHVLRVPMCEGCMKEDVCKYLSYMTELVIAGIDLDVDEMKSCELYVKEYDEDDLDDEIEDCDECPHKDTCDEAELSDKAEDIVSEMEKTELLAEILMKMSKVVGKDLLVDGMIRAITSTMEHAKELGDRIRSISLDLETIHRLVNSGDKRIKHKDGVVTIHHKGDVVLVKIGSGKPGVPEFDIVPR